MLDVRRCSSVLAELNRRFLTAAGPQSKWIRNSTADAIHVEKINKSNTKYQLAGDIAIQFAHILYAIAKISQTMDEIIFGLRDLCLVKAVQ